MRSIVAASASDLAPWREQFRRQATGQIVHDSLHGRAGWTQAYLLKSEHVTAGYGAVAVNGPWQGTRTVFEFYLTPAFQTQAAALFADFLRASAATHFEIQTDPPLLRALAGKYVKTWTTDRIVFRDEHTTTLPTRPGAILRQSTAADKDRIFDHHLEPVGDWIVELDGVPVATGGWLSHYNPPHRDLYMEVAEPFRRRGIGSWLLQELKRACREAGGIPCARCHPDNAGSRACLLLAGFAPWCEIVTGEMAEPPGGGR
jgi:GNAT superfamily N-acetyltransferase